MPSTTEIIIVAYQAVIRSKLILIDSENGLLKIRDIRKNNEKNS